MPSMKVSKDEDLSKDEDTAPMRFAMASSKTIVSSSYKVLSHSMALAFGFSTPCREAGDYL